jgi:transposase
MAKLNTEARMTIKTLARKGIPNTQIADMLGVTEGTVRYQRRRMAEPPVDGRSLQPQRAAAYGEAIAYWREQRGEAVNLAELHVWLEREHGYTGSVRSIQRYYGRAYPPPKVRARRRVETPPGAQSQVDWAHFPGIIIGGERCDLYGFRLVLSHSRYAPVVWSTGKDQLAWHRCHNEALRRAGGVTATIRVDNEKTAVVRGAGAWGVINPSYRSYARLMRFHIDACAPRQPQTKGKVERNVRSHRGSANPKFQAWRDLEELQAWSDEHVELDARRRVCPSTGTTVQESWEAEKPLLTPLPEPMWEPFDLIATRRVSLDCLVSFESRRYSVPFALTGESVEVRGCAETVQVLHGGQIVAVHRRHTDARLIIDRAHYDGESTLRVQAPTPLGRMGRRIHELASMPVEHRSIELYHALAEVAR